MDMSQRGEGQAGFDFVDQRVTKKALHGYRFARTQPNWAWQSRQACKSIGSRLQCGTHDDPTIRLLKNGPTTLAVAGRC